MGAKVLYLGDLLDYLNNLNLGEYHTKNDLLADIQSYAIKNSTVPDMEEITEAAYEELEAKNRMLVIKEILINQFELPSKDAEMLTDFDRLDDDELFSCQYTTDDVEFAMDLLIHSPHHKHLIKDVMRKGIKNK